MLRDDNTALAGRKAVVFGGCGLLGGNVAAALVASGAQVVAFDLAPPAEGAALDGVDYRCGDILDESAVRRVVEDANAVFAFAGGLGATRSLAEPLLDLRTSCEAQVILLEALRHVAPNAAVVFPGSRLEYGRAETLPVSEEHPLSPTSPYAANRTACAAYYRLYHELYGLHTCVLRLANVYGGRATGTAARKGFGVLNIFVDTALAGGEIPVWGDGAQLRDFVHVDDVVAAALAAAVTPEAAGQVLNVGSGEPVSIRAAADAAVAAAGTGSVNAGIPWPDDAASVETGDFYFDIGRACAILHWRPRVTLENGVRGLVEDARGETGR